MEKWSNLALRSAGVDHTISPDMNLARTASGQSGVVQRQNMPHQFTSYLDHDVAGCVKNNACSNLFCDTCILGEPVKDGACFFSGLQDCPIRAAFGFLVLLLPSFYHHNRTQNTWHAWKNVLTCIDIYDLKNDT